MNDELSYFDAILQAQQEEMHRDQRVILIGEDISLYGATGLLKDLGPDRLRSTPISENSFCGMAVGAAITGLRPIVDLTIASFIYLAMDQLVQQAAKLRYLSGGQLKVPVVFRASMWHNGSNAAQHSDRPYPMLMNVPGLKVLAPATPADMKGLLKSAVRDDNPVVVFEDNDLWFRKGPVPRDPDWLVPLGRAATHREGSDITLVAISGTVPAALEAAEVLAGEGISVEVLDPRSLVPLDRDSVLRSVARTGRLAIVESAHRCNGAAAEIAAGIAEEGFAFLKQPIRRIATPDVPIPFSPALEKPLYPSCETIVQTLRKMQ